MSYSHFSRLALAMCISQDVYAVHRTDNESEERLRYLEENNVSSANAQRVVSIQSVDKGDVTEVFEDHKEVQIDEYETDSVTRNQILKNIQSLPTERVLHDPAGLFVHLCAPTCKM